MRLATQQLSEWKGLGSALERWLRPAVGFDHPTDVLKDPLLDHAEKRAILASWASDASAVTDEPQMRWLLGTPSPVRLSEIRDAIKRLDRLETHPGTSAFTP